MGRLTDDKGDRLSHLDWPYASSVPPAPRTSPWLPTNPTSSRRRTFAAKCWNSPEPWRTSGDWWTTNPWARDEWDIALSDGALYRIYCEPRGWFVEGSYD